MLSTNNYSKEDKFSLGRFCFLPYKYLEILIGYLVNERHEKDLVYGTQHKQEDTTTCLPVETGISSCWMAPWPCPCTDWPVRKNCGAATCGWPNKWEGLDIDVMEPVSNKTASVFNH